MKKLCLLLAAVFLMGTTATSTPAAGAPGGGDSVTPLVNKDVLRMVQKKVETETIIKIIKSSPCTFDTFPPMLQDLRQRGVPEEVLQAMVEAPYGPSAASKTSESADEPIYHYADQLKQMGIINTSVAGRAGRATRQERARASRNLRRRN